MSIKLATCKKNHGASQISTQQNSITNVAALNSPTTRWKDFLGLRSSHLQCDFINEQMRLSLFFQSLFEDRDCNKTEKKKKNTGILSAAVSTNQLLLIHSPSESGCDDRWGDAGATARSLALSLSDYNSALSIQGRLRLSLGEAAKLHPRLLSTRGFSQLLRFDQSWALI